MKHLPKASREEIEAETKKIRQLRFQADLVCALLYQERISLDEARALINGARKAALHLFPGSGATFDLIYGSRFRRILLERFPCC